MSESNGDNLVSVGLDVGSQNVRVYFSNSTQQEPSIVPNEIGQRYTLALSTPEPEIESDPMNDQYWDLGKKKKDDAKKAKIHYLHGDAARKSLQRLKKPLGPHTILNMVKEENASADDNTSDSDPKSACASYFKHVTNLATNASHTSPQNLRFVVSTPPAAESDNSTSLQNLASTVQDGILQCITEAGYKKSDKKKIFNEKRIVAVITHPVAICHAHKLFDPSKPSGTKNVLVADWGASSLSVSHLTITSGIAQIQKHVCEPSLSGKNIIALLVKHIAELFERKNRGIPPGEVLCNKKAKAKLEVAAENALRSFGFSQKVTVTVDGLFEGLDCHVDVMLARFEMLMGPILRKAEATLKGLGDFDTVIGAGNIISMKCVEKMMNRLYPKETVFRGRSANDVPPDEAVAMGCTVYGSSFLSSDFTNLIEEEIGKEEPPYLVQEKVPLCPVAIGLRLVTEDPAAIIMVEKGTPLPSLVTKMVDVSGCSSNSMDIVQIFNDEEKTVGRIEGFDAGGTKEVEVTMELEPSGNLSISLNGGPVINL